MGDLEEEERVGIQGGRRLVEAIAQQVRGLDDGRLGILLASQGS